MTDGDETPEQTFSDELELWLKSDTTPTFESLGEVFAEKVFAATVLLLMFVPALPLPTGGISHVFEGVTVLVAAQMVAGRRTLWLPRRMRTRELGPLATEKAIPFMLKWVRRFERLARPRGTALFAHGWANRIFGLMLMGLAIGAALAPPFSGLDTLPALGAVIITLAIIFEDVVILAIGAAIGAGGILVIVTVGAVVVRMLHGVF